MTQTYSKVNTSEIKNKRSTKTWLVVLKCDTSDSKFDVVVSLIVGNEDWNLPRQLQ